jgi:fatty acid desaturase
MPDGEHGGMVTDDAGTSGLRIPAAALKDLYVPSPALYWADLLVSAGAGWVAFAVACASHNDLLTMASLVLSILLLYRAHLFIHELSHAARRIPGFSPVWNLVAGFPLLVPSCFAVGVHAHHHNRRIYGTARDPEYLPFAFSRLLILRFVLLTLTFPELMALRFLLAAPVAMLIPSLQRFLERKATSLAMNPLFVREVREAEHRTIMLQQAGLLALWVPFLGLLGSGILPVSVGWCWLAMATGASFLNGIRTLGAHDYLGKGPEFDRLGQVHDSIDIPGRWWTGLWAPVGHRYHALHHLVPALPYHNLGIAYQRLAAANALASPLAVSQRDSLLGTIAKLWSRAGGTVRDPA